MAQIGMIIGLLVLVGWWSVFMKGVGEDAKTAELSPVIAGWEKRYNKLNHDFLMTGTEGDTKAAEDKAELDAVGVITEVDHAKRKAEIKAEAEKYLDSLFTRSGGLLGYPKDTSRLYTGENPRRLLSDLAAALPDSCSGKRQLFDDLREVGRGLAEEIYIPCNKTTEELRDLKTYSQKLEKKNAALKAENAANRKLIKDTQL